MARLKNRYYCQKVGYKTEEEARAEAKKLFIKKGRKLAPYVCPRCADDKRPWHLSRCNAPNVVAYFGDEYAVK